MSAVVAVTFDNLGEAAELQLGGAPPDGEHYTIADVLPRLLDALAERDILATFFIEGVNAERYPRALRAIAEAGHELGYHAWCHEQWDGLERDQLADNLRRGAEAFDRLGLRPAGFRPPGGQAGDDTEHALHELGYRYMSPEGDGPAAGLVNRVPFRWPLVDAYWVLPQYGQEQGIGRFAQEVDEALERGGYVPLIMHPFLWADPAIEEAERDVLDRVAGSGARLARMGELP
jgi:peptidoglycan/xylan/chitin deacetylase (PgdA/CDA1 family)